MIPILLSGSTEETATAVAVSPEQRVIQPLPMPVDLSDTVIVEKSRPVSIKKILTNHSIKLTIPERMEIAYGIMQEFAATPKKQQGRHSLGVDDLVVDIGKGKPGARTVRGYILMSPSGDFHFASKGKTFRNIPKYASPETILHSKLEGEHAFESDLYSIGCMFWELMKGKAPLWSNQKYYRKGTTKKEHYYEKRFFINALRSQTSRPLTARISKLIAALKKETAVLKKLTGTSSKNTGDKKHPAKTLKAPSPKTMQSLNAKIQKLTAALRKETFFGIVVKMVDPVAATREKPKAIFTSLEALLHPKSPEETLKKPHGSKHKKK